METKAVIVTRNVLIERDEKDMPFTSPLKVFLHFDATKPVGIAQLHLEKDGLYADFHISEKLPDTIMWPAIGYNTDPNRINQIGLCFNPNVDSKIPCFPNF